jgi:hypothetical protein
MYRAASPVYHHHGKDYPRVSRKETPSTLSRERTTKKEPHRGTLDQSRMPYEPMQEGELRK